MAALRPSRPSVRSSRDQWLVVAAVTSVALLARLLPVLRGGRLDGVYGYDDGVYYTAAASLLAGRAPYAHFTLLHPPGIVLLLAPFAMLGRFTSDHVGIAAARLGFMALGAVNAGLISTLGARLARHVGAPIAVAAVGGVFYALWYSSIYATRTTLLEGLGSFSLLLAIAFVWPVGPPNERAATLAGAALAFGACTKIWGLVPAIVVAAWVWRRFGRGLAVRLVASGVVLAVLVCGPFLALAPTAMPRMVLLDQIGRPRTTRSPIARALDASSLRWNVPSLTGAAATLVLSAMVLLLILVCVVAWRSQGELPVLLLAATSLTLVLSPTYFTHYGEFVAAPLALVLTGAASTWAVRARRLGPLRLPVVVPIVALVLLELPTQVKPMGSAIDAARLRTAVATARCVTTETPSMLAITDSLTRSLHAGCQVPVDLTGSVYDTMRQLGPNGRAVPRLHNTRYQQHLVQYLMDADAQVLVQPARKVLDARGLQELHRNRLALAEGSLRVYRRG